MAAIVDRHYEVLILLAGAAVERQELVPFQRRLHAHQIHLLSAFSTSRCRHRRHIRLPKPTTKAAIAVKPIIPINRAHLLTGGGSSIPGRYLMHSKATRTALVPGRVVAL